MKTADKLAKITSIINSCETYDQVLTCFTFVNRPFFTDILLKYKVLGAIQSKAYTIRKTDLKIK